MPLATPRIKKLPKEATRQILFRLDEQTYLDWENILRKHGIGKSACLRLLIEKFMREKRSNKVFV